MPQLIAYLSAKITTITKKKNNGRILNGLKLFLNLLNLRIIDSVMGLRPRQGNLRQVFQIFQVSSEALPRMRLE